MWIFKYIVCLVKKHNWVGSGYRYCLRCGKLEAISELGQSAGEGSRQCDAASGE